MGQLDNKVAVITGGSSGIGLAAAQRFIEEGAVVYVTGRREQELQAAAAKVGAIPVQGDATNPADLDRLYDTGRADGRQIDVVVANAGNAGRWVGGSVAQWVEELTGAVLEHGASGFMFIEPGGATQDPTTLGRWATEIAPAVREAVANGA